MYEEEKSTNYVFVLPGLEISGGIKVALRHAAMLQKKGNEVSIFTLDCNEKWCEFEDCRFPVINLEDTTISGKIDNIIWFKIMKRVFTKRQIRCVYGRISLTDHRQT